MKLRNRINFNETLSRTYNVHLLEDDEIVGLFPVDDSLVTLVDRVTGRTPKVSI